MKESVICLVCFGLCWFLRFSVLPHYLCLSLDPPIIFFNTGGFWFAVVS